MFVIYFYKVSSSFRGRRNILDLAIVILHENFGILDILYYMIFLKSVLAGNVRSWQGTDSVIEADFSEIY